MKFGNKALAIALLFVGLVLVNYLASSLPVRVDATAESIYSLSPGTKALLGKIEEPITLRLFFSPRLGREIPLYANYHQRVRDLLDEYNSLAAGKIKLEFFDPEPFSDTEDRALAFGLQL